MEKSIALTYDYSLFYKLFRCLTILEHSKKMACSFLYDTEYYFLKFF